ncbi:hypothetical protein TNCV_1954191 [Trichonephila clavipes]|nr:hypothetical protein TNCV_1954191 [Trichonephila clavipes]
MVPHSSKDTSSRGMYFAMVAAAYPSGQAGHRHTWLACYEFEHFFFNGSTTLPLVTLSGIHGHEIGPLRSVIDSYSDATEASTV